MFILQEQNRDIRRNFAELREQKKKKIEKRKK